MSVRHKQRLFHAERSRLMAERDRVEARSALLPRPSSGPPGGKVNDAF
jgi:hypothetical protein